jgi:hypothetical protein
MKADNAKTGMMVRDRKTLAFGMITGTKGEGIVYVDGDAFVEAEAEDLDPVAVMVPILVRLTCPCCGESSNRKPFTGWVVETCLDCGEKYAAGPFQVGPPLEVTDEQMDAAMARGGEPC